VRFIFQYQSKPNHKLVSPEPHFVEEERNLIENHFSYLGPSYKTDDIEEWNCFNMDNEGHLVSLRYTNSSRTNFQLSNESIEHLSNFPHLRNFHFSSFTSKSNKIDNQVTNFSLLSNLRMLSMYGQEIQNSELLKDLGMFTNLLSLSLSQPTTGNLTHLNHNLLYCF